MEDKDTVTLSKNIIASTHINFLFGAGVNGKALPQLKNFKDTLAKIEEFGGDVSNGLESGIDNIESEHERKEIKRVFIEEFKRFYGQAMNVAGWDENESLKNLKILLRKTYAVIHETQNRNPSMKQVNIYTLNYDDIVEKTLAQLGYFYNAISASNTATKAVLMNVIGFDYKMRKYIPSFMVSKLHGDIDKPIIPGRAKYRDMLNEDYFEIAFNMKEQLCRYNSILIVIGYSGRDNHINKILQDCINAGLTIYWFKYGENDCVPFTSSQHINIIEQKSYSSPEDTTKVCYDMMENEWKEKLDE